jgi:hypothetical protein
MGTKRPHSRRDWDRDLREIGKRAGFEVVAWDGYPAKKNKVLIRCIHGERWVFPNGQLNKEHCCRAASKAGDKNPFFGKPTWNAGTKGISTGHGFGFKPRGEETFSPGKLYLVEYNDNGEIHFKLGITGRSTRQRLQTKLQHVIKEWEMPLGKCFDLEQATLRYAAEHGHRYSSPTTTELIRPEGILPVLEFIEHSLDDDGYLAQS